MYQVPCFDKPLWFWWLWYYKYFFKI